MFTRNAVIGLLAGAVSIVSVPAAHAQAPAPATEKYFFNFNLGGQLADRTTTSTAAKAVYDETATLVATQPIGKGLVFDFSGGYRVREDIYAALSITRFSNTQAASYTATIPDPGFFSSVAPPKTVTGNSDELKRTEVGIHPHVLWVTPLTDKIDVAVGLGLAITQLKQEVLGDFNVPPSTQNVEPIIVSESGTALGLYVAADFIYTLTPRYGVGAIIRYAGGSADLGSVESTDVGGLQIGAGIRVRF